MSCHIWSGRGLVEAWSRFGRASVQGSAASRTTPPQSGRYGDVTCDLLNVHTPNACTCIQPCCRTSRTPCRMSHRHVASPMLHLNFAGSINDMHPVFGVGNTRDNALPHVSQTCGCSPVCVIGRVGCVKFIHHACYMQLCLAHDTCFHASLMLHAY